MITSNYKYYTTVKDYSVSGEIFELYKHEEFDYLITIPKPSEKDLFPYYKSKDYISHTDRKKYLFEKIYHFIRSIALERKLKLLNKEQSEKGKILDIGAGTGNFLVLAKKNNWNVIGIEPDEKARKISIDKGISFVSSTKDLKDNSFDIITMWHVLEHIYNLEEQIKELKRILKPTGTIIIAVPNYKSFDAGYYGKFWAAFDVPRHLWHFSKKSIHSIFKKENLIITKILPMKWDAFYVSLLSEKYKTGKINYFKAFYIGYTSNRKARKSKEYSSQIYIINNGKNKNKLF